MANAKPKFLPRIEGAAGGAGSSSGTPYIAIADGNPFETEEQPIFRKCKMALRIPPHCSGDFTHLAVSKNWIVCLLATAERTTMLRFLRHHDIPPAEIALEKYLTGSGYKITKIFLDPSGHHLIISLVPKSPGVSADFLYIHGNGSKVRRIEKFKDHEITAVGFNNYDGNESTTSAILLGTSRGLIFETELSLNGDTQRKQLFDLGLGRSKYPITSLELLRMPNINRYIVVATTPNCIYTFHETLRPEERSLQLIFAGYVNGSKQAHCEESKTDLNQSQLRFFAPPNSKYPQQWAWLCSSGIRVGQLSVDPNSNTPLLNGSLISLDLEQHKHLSYDERRLNVPKSFVLTEYHALLLYADHLKAICLLNQDQVYFESFDENSHIGKLLNIERDAFTGEIYVYTEKAVFNMRITQEERNIWRIYLERGQYELATAHAGTVPEHLQLVLSHRAEAAFSDGNYETAANYYAETDQVFEEICLKFMVLPDKRPIINYIKKRLNKLTATLTAASSSAVGTAGASASTDLAQLENAIKALVVWLIDLYLTQINMPERGEDARQAWQTEYNEFMRAPAVLNCTRQNRMAVQQLISQHADPHNLAQFAISIGDYEEVISQQLNANRHAEALQTLRKQSDIKLYYKYAPMLMEQLPGPTIDALIAKGANLEINKLVPALIDMDTREQRQHIMRYLEFAVYQQSVTDASIHNFLLHLYAQYNPKQLMTYLDIQGRDNTLVHYDIRYALKVCMECDVKEACVFLQSLLCMWKTAVDLALKFDMKLAKETANRPDDEEIKRNLWLRIAYHEIKGSNDVKKALNLLKECNLLRIEDLLPFFSDFEKIDNFKEAICEALKNYNKSIQDVQHEMAESTERSERVSKDMQQLRSHSIRMEAQELCSICELILLVKPFFAFICGHKYHSDCLEKQVVPMLSKERSRHLTMLKQQMEALMTQTLTSTTAEQQKKRLDLKSEIEEILAAECLYCGMLIDTIDQPFVDDCDRVNVEWE